MIYNFAYRVRRERGCLAAINIILHTCKMGRLLNPTGLLIIASDELAGEPLFPVIPAGAFNYVIFLLSQYIPLHQNYNKTMLFVSAILGYPQIC